MRKNRVTLVCAHCNKSFEVPASVAKRGRQYCSNTCAYAAKWVERIERVCEQCGNTYYVAPNRLALGTNRYCSNACRHLADRVEYIACTCKTCGKAFSIKPSSAKNGEGKYCSYQCKWAEADVLKGLDHPMYNRVSKVCDVCGTAFTTAKSQDHTVFHCSEYCQGIARQRKRQQEIEQQFGEPLRELLARLHHQDERGFRGMARLTGVAPITLMRWFDELGIQRRSRSDASKLQFRDNPDRRKAVGQRFQAYRREMEAKHPGWTRDKTNHARIACQSRRISGIERRMMAALDLSGIAYTSQYLVNNRFLCDLLINGTSIIIECDGDYWHSLPKVKANDHRKSAYLKACGYTLLRFTETQINKDVDACVEQIKAHL